jgi:hypothetical protein
VPPTRADPLDRATFFALPFWEKNLEAALARIRERDIEDSG